MVTACDRYGTLCSRCLRRAKSFRYLPGLHERLCRDASTTRYSDSREDQRATLLGEGSRHHRAVSRGEVYRESQGGAVVGLAELLGCWRCHVSRSCAASG